MNKASILLFIFLIFLPNGVQATEEIINQEKEALKINEFIEAAEEYTKEVFPELDMNELMNNSIKGEVNLGFLKNIFIKLIGEEIVSAINLMISILIILIINSVCKSIIENLGNEDTIKIIYILQYLTIVMIVLVGFKDILLLTKNTITKITNFMNLLVPLFTTLILTTGAIASSNILEPIILLVINFVGNFSNNFLVPLLLMAIVLTIVSNISEKAQLEEISKFFKASTLWILGIVLTLFTGLLSLEGTLSSSVDGLTSKTAKAAVSTLIPVVGKILGDTVETVIGCANILKNTVGFIGVVIIIGIVSIPITRLVIYTICFKLTSAIGGAVADARIVKLIARFGRYI